MTLWTSKEIAQAVGGKASEGFVVESLSIDTRSLEAGALFVPLKDVRDGHEFIPQAMKAGASGTLSEKALDGVPHVRVKDSLSALQSLAKAAAARSSAKRIAVTGSVGKTSVKDALAIMFAAFGSTHRSIKSFNNHWGVPLTLAGMPKKTEFGVFEMGMNHAGEISELSKLVVPHIALITTVAPAHLAHFNNVEEIADAKGEIIEGLQNDGCLILNGDNQYTPRIREKAGQKRVMTFGRGPQNDVIIKRVDLSANDTTVFLAIGNQDIKVQIPIAGEHWAFNVAACLCVADAAGLDLDKAAKALKAIKPAIGRGDVTPLRVNDKSVLLVDESYNANPTSMRAAFAALSHREARRIAVLGDMYELGADEIALHADLSGPIVDADIARVIVTGECMRALRGALPQRRRAAWVENADDAYHALLSELEDGDVVMIKGSNATGLGALARRLKGEFSSVL